MKRKIVIIISAAVVGALAIGLTIYFATKSGGDAPPPEPSPVAAHPTYVFELVRHGARSPLMRADDFPAQAEMLTPQGGIRNKTEIFARTI